MSEQDLDLAHKLDDLRRSFDQAFAVPPPQPPAEIDSFLAIQAGGDLFALRVGELTGLVAHRKIVALPIGSPEFLGLAGIQGRLAPVYSLAALLGYAGEYSDEGRWFAVCGQDDPIGL